MEEITYGLIYCVTNLLNGKRYIGKTTQTTHRRWQAHCSAVRSNQNHMFVNALRKHGVENFVCEQIDVAYSKEELDRLEMFHIAMHQTFTDRSKGYNSTVGGDGLVLTPEILAKRNATNTGKTRSEETKARMRVAQAINLARPEVKKAISDGLIGRPMSEKTREAIRVANIGRVQTQETLDKIMTTRRSNPEKFATHMKAMADANRGKKRSPEAIEKTAAAKRGTKLTQEQIDHLKQVAIENGYAEKMSAVGKANLGRKYSDEEKKLMSDKMKASWVRRKALKAAREAAEQTWSEAA